MSTSAGQAAEAAAAQWLEDKGYEVVDKNWRTKWCEIDLIMLKDGRVHFVEVKYRRQPESGTGLSYITDKKLNQMKFAAELWVSMSDEQENWELAAIELSGQPPAVSEFIPELT